MTSLATSLKIVSANPLEHAEEIKELFLANERPEFPEFFDRAYPSAVRGGGKSWIGVDADGRLVMHIARFPHRFAFGERTVVSGLLVNLMAAKSHRTVVPALTLMRQVTADSKGERDVDFLYADPNAAGTALLKAAGFATVGTLKRFVFPLAGGRWYTDAIARVYHARVRVRAWNHGARAVEYTAQHFNPDAFERPAGASPALRAFRPPDLYRQRLAGYPSSTDHWFTFHENARSTQPSAAVLVRGSLDRTATLYSLSREPSLRLFAIVPSLTAALRRAGYRRLSVSTLAGTHFAEELTRAGFIPREDSDPIMVCAVTELGADALRAAATWEITELDCDR
ncbi:MAG: hypothetical protein M3303_00760 [Gemmatimonadota bacterium]|nr:hypothetical protein [Gemmatimonadota bacterium]